MPKPVDESTSGVDRRSALKKAAVAGAVAWSAPTVLSSRAHAVDILPGGCTAKCAFDGTAGFSGGTVQFQPCGVGPAGQQGIFFTVSAGNGDATGACGCGGDPVVLDAFVTGGQGFIPDPGNGQFDVEGFAFAVTVVVACSDRQGNTIVSTCTGTGAINCPTTGDCAGNCQSLPGKSPRFDASGLSCSVTACNP